MSWLFTSGGQSIGASGYFRGLMCQEFNLFNVSEISLEKEWQPTPVFLPGISHGHRSLPGYSTWGHKELAMTEQLSTSEI